MRVGGDFFFDPAPSDPAVDLLLVAGGVGINPLYSILLHAADLLETGGGRGRNVGTVHLCYSAKSTEELLFRVRAVVRLSCVKVCACVLVSPPSRVPQNSIVDACRRFPDNFSCDFHVTQQSSEVEPDLRPFLHREYMHTHHMCQSADESAAQCFSRRREGSGRKHSH